MNKLLSNKLKSLIMGLVLLLVPATAVLATPSVPAAPPPPTAGAHLPQLWDATSNQIANLVKTAKQPVFVYYYNSTDPAWSDQMLVIQQAARDRENYMALYKVDVSKDDDPGSLVAETPTMVILNHDENGNVVVVNSMSGYHEYPDLWLFFHPQPANQSSGGSSIQSSGSVPVVAEADLYSVVQHSHKPVAVLHYRKGSVLSEAQAYLFVESSQRWSSRMNFVIVKDSPRTYDPGIDVYLADPYKAHPAPAAPSRGFTVRDQLDDFLGKSLKPPCGDGGCQL